MRQILTTHKFERRFAIFIKRYPEHRDKVRIRMKAIATDPFKSFLNTHKLSGQLDDCWSSSVTHGFRIIFELIKGKIRFINIGSHDEVY